MTAPAIIASAVKVLAVWEALRGHTVNGLSNAEIVAATGQSAPNVSRALATLIEAGYATRYDTGRFAHSIKTLQIAEAHRAAVATLRQRVDELEQRITAGTR